ncbi:glycosyltransferase family 4 protein [Rubrivirga sp.]|uniref:glycosyltransferase family 4 protein n=1 Tax=Rubrivirga sp. TaxID=1885344 RepID=UPI003B5230FB
MTERGPAGTITLVYDSPISFSGQYAATALIREALAERGWTFRAVEFPALDRTAGRVARYLGYVAQVARCWRALAATVRAGTVLHVNLPQSRAAFAKMGWPVRLADRLRPSVPKVVSLHGSVFMGWPRASAEARAFVRILGAADVVTVLGPNQRARLVEWGIDPARVVVVENTCELAPATPAAVEEKHSLGADEPLRLLHLSLLVESKGYPEFLEAVELLAGRGLGRPVEAVLCGPPAFTSFCTRFTTVEAKAAWIEAALGRINARAGVRAEWVPGARGAEKQALFDAAQVFVFPSRFPVEAQPLVLLEAMASGCALVTSRAGEIPSTLGEGTAVLLDETTPAAIADAVERLATDDGLRRSLAAAALARVRTRFGLDRYGDVWDGIFRSLTATPAPA